MRKRQRNARNSHAMPPRIPPTTIPVTPKYPQLLYFSQFFEVQLHYFARSDNIQIAEAIFEEMKHSPKKAQPSLTTYMTMTYLYAMVTYNVTHIYFLSKETLQRCRNTLRVLKSV
jgi:hypothetical protein